jgi:hypothetical protein
MAIVPHPSQNNPNSIPLGLNASAELLQLNLLIYRTFGARITSATAQLHRSRANNAIAETSFVGGPIIEPLIGAEIKWARTGAIRQPSSQTGRIEGGSSEETKQVKVEVGGSAGAESL